MPLTRIAPTPSGFLHEGNRLNFQLTADLAERVGARIALRIDDADAARYRPEYVDDIFATLDAMGITWDVGPRDPDDFARNWSQRGRTEHYRRELAAAVDRGLPVYACACSRAQQKGPAVGGCSGGCRNRALVLEHGSTALRVAVEPGTMVSVDGHAVDIAAAMGDFVIWRRDDLPAYHLVSVLEDRDLGVTHIVRGEDLLASSAAQVHIAPWLDAQGVAVADYILHALVLDGRGDKLSKSTLSAQEREERRHGG